MSTIDDIRRFIASEIIRSPSISLASTDRLIERGYLTSLDVLQLVTFLEEELQVEIAPEDVTEQHFQTLESIAALVESMRERQRAEPS